MRRRSGTDGEITLIRKITLMILCVKHCVSSHLVGHALERGEKELPRMRTRRGARAPLAIAQRSAGALREAAAEAASGAMGRGR